MMKLLSIQVGHPRKVKWRRRTVTTGIYKDPVEGRIMLRRSNLEGDEQADLAADRRSGAGDDTRLGLVERGLQPLHVVPEDVVARGSEARDFTRYQERRDIVCYRPVS